MPPDLGKGDGRLIATALSRIPKTAQAATLPRVANVSANLAGDAPELKIETLFPEGAKGTDVFVDNPRVLVPVPKPLGSPQDGKQVFEVTFFTPEEAEAIKGKPLTITVVSDRGASQTTWTAD